MANAQPAADRAAAQAVSSEPTDTTDTRAAVASAAAAREAGAAHAVARSDTRIAHAEPGAIVPPSSRAAYLRNPVYPSISRRFGEQGRVVLRVFVERDGRPTQVSIGTSSGYTRLDSAALDAVRGWTFVPATRGEERVAAWVLVPVQFRLDRG
jgi:protein TonB